MGLARSHLAAQRGRAAHSGPRGLISQPKHVRKAASGADSNGKGLTRASKDLKDCNGVSVTVPVRPTSSSMEPISRESSSCSVSSISSSSISSSTVRTPSIQGGSEGRGSGGKKAPVSSSEEELAEKLSSEEDRGPRLSSEEERAPVLRSRGRGVVGELSSEEEKVPVTKRPAASGASVRLNSLLQPKSQPRATAAKACRREGCNRPCVLRNYGFCGEHRRQPRKRRSADRASSSSNPLSTGWDCKACTYVNKGSDDVCGICNTKRRQESRKRRGSDASSSSKPSKRSRTLSREQLKLPPPAPTRPKWHCGKCTYTNTGGVDTCQICRSARGPDSRIVQNWSCPRCTFKNPSGRDACELCGSPRTLRFCERCNSSSKGLDGTDCQGRACRQWQSELKSARDVWVIAQRPRATAIPSSVLVRLKKKMNDEGLKADIKKMNDEGLKADISSSVAFMNLMTGVLSRSRVPRSEARHWALRALELIPFGPAAVSSRLAASFLKLRSAARLDNVDPITIPALCKIAKNAIQRALEQNEAKLNQELPPPPPPCRACAEGGFSPEAAVAAGPEGLDPWRRVAGALLAQVERGHSALVTVLTEEWKEYGTMTRLNRDATTPRSWIEGVRAVLRRTADSGNAQSVVDAGSRFSFAFEAHLAGAVYKIMRQKKIRERCCQSLLALHCVAVGVLGGNKESTRAFINKLGGNERFGARLNDIETAVIATDAAVCLFGLLPDARSGAGSASVGISSALHSALLLEEVRDAFCLLSRA